MLLKHGIGYLRDNHQIVIEACIKPQTCLVQASTHVSIHEPPACALHTDTKHALFHTEIEVLRDVRVPHGILHELL
jgi:hypothetical protein